MKASLALLMVFTYILYGYAVMYTGRRRSVIAVVQSVHTRNTFERGKGLFQLLRS
ncbi:hypothetical protein Desti_5113 [Desulfomonile tiedjei DSM 6799]|uniref:Uncharacterized protein n=1 Tax=Desulfomonile tiedjei (strain ATCC 49306 / DSM 6799 / DCB-1) TaxID=706587 RepID=I4CDS9_DESTA|nr:hypothetical protein Desti_5113 [Desulfomonile tiedjei DSM 6799]